MLIIIFRMPKSKIQNTDGTWSLTRLNISHSGDAEPDHCHGYHRIENHPVSIEQSCGCIQDGVIGKAAFFLLQLPHFFAPLLSATTSLQISSNFFPLCLCCRILRTCSGVAVSYHPPPRKGDYIPHNYTSADPSFLGGLGGGEIGIC